MDKLIADIASADTSTKLLVVGVVFAFFAFSTTMTSWITSTKATGRIFYALVAAVLIGQFFLPEGTIPSLVAQAKTAVSGPVTVPADGPQGPPAVASAPLATPAPAAPAPAAPAPADAGKN